MKYFIDTEFIEGKQDKTIFGIKYGETKPTIDLISIGIVAEDGREYYAISKEFNLREAWNRCDLVINKQYPLGDEYNKVYWIRENVLKPIFFDLFIQNEGLNKEMCLEHKTIIENKMTYSWLKQLINKYGKTNKQIAEEIKEFVGYPDYEYRPKTSIGKNIEKDYPIFYGYYSAYDWVIFCQLFETMNNLPTGFPMYCIDLKQILDEKAKLVPISYTIEEGLKSIKMSENYPKQTYKHNALSDARFNNELYEFLQKL